MNTQHIFACALCHKPSPQAGCRIRRVKGLRTRICAKCAGEHINQKKEQK